ncbi:hypothetical protein B0H15DRAFT_855118 [Mycena belliarum]|uniref:Uncharacterized protein n=1 Tax=Mycena belliarum TaxID=1033014 RepID=A0AAD6U0Z7_9AGAR|nr:hypothetical protein B0H15DRAFT_855118 [Mycena belliae]
MHILILVLVTALPAAIRATQAAFQSDAQWSDLSASPSPNATGHLIFDTVSSLLQHWPNTRYRNGHNIVPGTVPVGTLLYHGRKNSSVPAIPEWTSLDPEHSYHFCGSSPTNGGDPAGCWQLTFVATRPLKVLYFDGSSAANMRGADAGTLDAQDLLVWGEVDPDRWLEERARINAMCDWGREFGIEGYVRMEMDFEVMLCDFTAGVELLAADFLAAWHRRFITPPVVPTDRNKHVAEILRLEVVRAGSWHNAYPGDTRVALDLTRLVSFYDPALAPSLVAHRAGAPRWTHRVQNISHTDLAAVRARLRTVLAQSGSASGLDWRTLFRGVTDRYAERLELLAHLLNATETPARTTAALVQTQLRVMLTPYILHSARPGTQAAVDDAWAAPVWRVCATRHTAHIHAPAVRAWLTASEALLLGALDDTGREICRAVVRMWVRGVSAGLDELLPPGDEHVDVLASDGDRTADIARLVEDWRAETRALMAWLDWGVWVKCRPACGVEEMCYLPTWPYFWGWGFAPRDPDGDEDEETRGRDVWLRPQPRCIRVVEPYSTL